MLGIVGLDLHNGGPGRVRRRDPVLRVVARLRAIESPHSMRRSGRLPCASDPGGHHHHADQARELDLRRGVRRRGRRARRRPCPRRGGRGLPVSPGAGAALRFLASVLDARAVVEIGTGTGVSGLWLLRGMRGDGVLTTVDIEAEHQRLAKETFGEAGVPANRARTIAGAGLDVLPRLTDGHYDLVFCDGDKREYGEYLAEALRLLRPGGVVAFDNALWHDRVADPAQRDEETIAIRDLGRTIADARLAGAGAAAGRRRPALRQEGLVPRGLSA